MKNKMGFLLGEETVKIILAVIAIGFLIYFLTSLYFSYKDNKDLELAKASLDHLIKEMNNEITSVEIYNPKTWVLISWPYRGQRPNSCSSLGWDNCVCICKDVGIWDAIQALISSSVVEKSSEKCDSDGACLNYNKNIIVGTSLNDQRPIGINNILELDIEYGDEILINEK